MSEYNTESNAIYQNIAEKKVLVIGAGLSGQAAAQFLRAKGAKVTLTDSKTAEQLEIAAIAGIELLLGRMPDAAEAAAFDLAVISPGVPLTIPLAADLAAAKVPLIGELELAWQYSHSPYLAITGTNGKTTTTTLLGYILQQAGQQPLVGGNIGTPLVTSVETLGEGESIVAELSSFQLETAGDFKAHIAAFLNLTPDHLYRHGTMENYGAIKAKIFTHQTAEDYAVLNYDDELVRGWAPKLSGTVVFFGRRPEDVAMIGQGMVLVDGEVRWRWQGQEQTVLPAEDILIKGPHNLENAMAAAAMALLDGISVETVAAALRSFPGVEHRQEPVGEFGGVLYVNDSKGTNPDSTIMALAACTRPTVLILGGYEKNSDFSPLLPLIHEKVKHVVLVGETGSRIGDTLAADGFTNFENAGDDFAKCVELAAAAAKPGDEVLLSPASASWGMFKNFEERGELFKQLVRKLGQ